MDQHDYQEELDPHERKERLLAELDASRAGLRRSQARLRHRLDIKSQAQALIKKHPVAVSSAAVGGGIALAASLIGPKKSTRTHEPKKKRGLLRSGLGLAAGIVVKPLVKKWATNQVSSMIERTPTR